MTDTKNRTVFRDILDCARTNPTWGTTSGVIGASSSGAAPTSTPGRRKTTSSLGDNLRLPRGARRPEPFLR